MDSSDDEDSFDENFITSKDLSMRKIEFALADIESQIENGDTTLALRTSYDNAHFQIKYRKNGTPKLKRDLNCLRQVYDLLENDKKSTKRELYYEYKELYGKQTVIDKCIQQICQLLNEPRANLNILSSSKGQLRGAITFLSPDQGVINGRYHTVLITDDLLDCQVVSEAGCIIIVEKDTIFQKLLDENFLDLLPTAILVTGRGYPDICTRNVVKYIANTRNLPVFGIFDADPHGIEIYLTYKYGASIEMAEGRGANVPSMQWIGLYASDANRFPIEPCQFLQLSNLDHVKLQNLHSRCQQLPEPIVLNELNFIASNRFKLEMESMIRLGIGYMAEALIKPRIFNDYIA